MAKGMKNKKGLTILELIIALAIAASLLAIAFSFFLPQQKVLNDTTKRSQLQMDTQLIMESMTKSAMEASKISSITTKDGTLHTSDLDSLYNTKDLEKIVFSVYNTDNSGTRNLAYEYTYKIVGGKVTFTDSSGIEKTLAENVKAIKVTPLDGNSIGQCEGIKIEIQLASAGIKDYNTMSNVYFRNR